MGRYDSTPRKAEAIPEVPERFRNVHGPVRVLVRGGRKLPVPEVIPVTEDTWTSNKPMGGGKKGAQ